MLKVMDRLREVDSRTDTLEALRALPLSFMRSKSLSGFAREIELTGVDPIDAGDSWLTAGSPFSQSRPELMVLPDLLPLEGAASAQTVIYQRKLLTHPEIINNSSLSDVMGQPTMVRVKEASKKGRVDGAPAAGSTESQLQSKEEETQ